MRWPTYFLCHGGGPWPWIQGPLRDLLRGLEQGLLDVPRQWPHPPREILMISAHWEEADFTVTSSAAPGIIYDYSGFPPETYAIRYPSPGSPQLANQVMQLLGAAGFEVRQSETRGYDHGTYSVLLPMFPAAEIPVVQLSLRRSLDPAEHWRAGQALAGLRDEGVLIIGSGMTCHERGPDMRVLSPIFDAWLQDTLVRQPPDARRRSIEAWEQAPHARRVHAREEHLLPLMVVAGAAQEDPATCIYAERLGGAIAISSYRFGELPVATAA